MVTLPVIPAPPIALNGYADDRIAENRIAENKVNALVTEIKNDDVDVAENNDTNLNADCVESNDTNLNADGVESNDTNLNSDKVESNAGDDDNSGSNQHNEDDISKSDIGDINDANNDNCNSVIGIENVCKNSDTKAAGEYQKNCNDVDQKHSASNISGRTYLESIIPINYTIFSFLSSFSSIVGFNFKNTIYMQERQSLYFKVFNVQCSRCLHTHFIKITKVLLSLFTFPKSPSIPCR